MTQATNVEHADELALYERQLNFIEGMVSCHPESLNIFSPTQRQLFKKYFLPDWDKVKDYRVLYTQLRKQKVLSQKELYLLFEEYLDHHHVENRDRLLKP